MKILMLDKSAHCFAPNSRSWRVISVDVGDDERTSAATSPH